MMEVNEAVTVAAEAATVAAVVIVVESVVEEAEKGPARDRERRQR
jgi:hypothetical protein